MIRIATALMLLLLAAPALAAPPAAGMITRVQGAVQVVPAGSKSGQRADLLRPLQVGDRLEVPDRGLVQVVIYADGHQESAAGPATATVSASGLQGPTVRKSRSSQALAGLHTEAALGGSRGATATRHQEPRLPFPEVVLTPDAPVRNGRPVFGLPPLPGDGARIFIGLRDFSGKVVAEQALQDAERTWSPPEELPPGRYQVLLFEESGNVLARRVIAVGPADARLAGLLKELQTGTTGDPAPFVLASLVLETEGLLESALDAAEMALALEPSPALLRHAADLAARLGRSTQAAAYSRLAETLGAEPRP